MPISSESARTKFAKTFSKCLHPQTPSRFETTSHNNGKQQQLRTLSEELNMSIKFTRQKSQQQQQVSKNRATKEALISKLFASLSSIKAAYAELQSAQFPYNSDAIQLADESFINELMILSELKQKYFDNTLDLPPPHVTQLLAEIQEQQSNVKTYEITMKQLEWKIQKKDTEIASLKNKLEEISIGNKYMEKRVNSSGIICPLGNNVCLLELNQCHFITVLQHGLRSVEHFVKYLVRHMEEKNWDLDLAAKAIESNALFAKSRHKIFAFESFVSQIMFDGFNHHSYFLPDEEAKQLPRQFYFENFMKLQSVTTTHVISRNPRCPFAKFCKGKYLKLVQPKMECSIFGNLDQRKGVSSGAFPGTEFFSLFSEMARRVWLLHCLAFSFELPVVAFQVRRGCRFSEVYMESVAPGEDHVSTGEVTVAFTVVPGFKIGKTVVQSQVYLSPTAVKRS